jgi:hypothetical protein
LVLAAMVLVAACGGGGDDAGAGTTAAEAGGDTTTTAAPEDLEMQATDFTNINDMTPIRGYFIDNRLGHLDEAIAVAEDPAGGTYPVGTIIQLVPTEAMVKRAEGFSPATGDWEFFSLSVSPEGTEILARGGPDVVNQFGGSCADCHLQAEPQFDLVCEDTHGCDPLPIGDDVITAIQASDPRPRG